MHLLLQAEGAEAEGAGQAEGAEAEGAEAEGAGQAEGAGADFGISLVPRTAQLRDDILTGHKRKHHCLITS